MKVELLKEILKQYDDKNEIYIHLGLGTMYRLDKGIIENAPFDLDLYSIINAEKDNKTHSLILKLE